MLPSEGLSQSDTLALVTRKEWGARLPKEIASTAIPLSVVFIDHTAMGESFTPDTCASEMQRVQNAHMDENGSYYHLLF